MTLKMSSALGCCFYKIHGAVPLGLSLSSRRAGTLQGQQETGEDWAEGQSHPSLHAWHQRENKSYLPSLSVY